MNIRQTNSFLHSLVFFSICLLLLTVAHLSMASASATNPTPSIPLTKSERLYLKNKKKLTVVCDPAWPPFDFIDATGRHGGMAADYLKLFSERLEIPIQLIPTNTWLEALEVAKAGQCDLVSMLNETPMRSEYLNFTTPYVVSHEVIIGKEAGWLANGLADIRGKTLAVIPGYMKEEAIMRDFPSIRFIHAQSSEECLRMAAEGRVFATTATIVESSHLIRKNSFTDLKIIGETPYTNLHRLGIRKDDPVLLSIMQKAVDSLSSSDKEIIYTKWIAKNDEGVLEHRTEYILLGILTLILLSMFFWYRKAQ